MSLELNFVAHGLAHAIAAERVTGVIETAPAYASLLVHYDPGEVAFDRLVETIGALARSLGSTDTMTLRSRLFYFPHRLSRPVERGGGGPLHRGSRGEDP